MRLWLARAINFQCRFPFSKLHNVARKQLRSNGINDPLLLVHLHNVNDNGHNVGNGQNFIIVVILCSLSSNNCAEIKFSCNIVQWLCSGDLVIIFAGKLIIVIVMEWKWQRKKFTRTLVDMCWMENFSVVATWKIIDANQITTDTQPTLCWW